MKLVIDRHALADLEREQQAAFAVLIDPAASATERREAQRSATISPRSVLEAVVRCVRVSS